MTTTKPTQRTPRTVGARTSSPVGRTPKARHRAIASDSSLSNSLLWYRHRMGWPVHITNDSIRLPLAGGAVAVAFPAAGGTVVNANLAASGVAGPVLESRANINDHGRALALADANDNVVSQADLPPGVRLLTAPSEVALPELDWPNTMLRWLVHPSPKRRWLPSLVGVLSVVTQVFGAESIRR